LESYARPQQNVAAIAPASAAVPKQLRFAQALALISAEPFLTLRKQRWLLQSLY
jgi:hypothetical protein